MYIGRKKDNSAEGITRVDSRHHHSANWTGEDASTMIVEPDSGFDVLGRQSRRRKGLNLVNLDNVGEHERLNQQKFAAQLPLEPEKHHKKYR
jgi:hypothetical protein